MARVRAITLDCDNRYITIKGASKRIIRALDEATSYHVSGYYFSSAFKGGYWDGKEHLLKYVRREGTYKAPIGLLEDIIDVLDEEGSVYKVEEDRRRPAANIEVYWNPDIKLRPYQLRAVRSLIKRIKGPARGIGILKMPIRSGKTKTAAAVIALLKASTLFIVPSLQLLHQTKEALEDALGVPIGIIGDSTVDIQNITVASIHTLCVWKGTTVAKARRDAKERTAKRLNKKQDVTEDEKQAEIKKAVKKAGERAKEIRALYKSLKTRFDMLIMDECHHLTASDWRKAVMDFDARYRVGLSATAFPDIQSENERGVIWLKGCCGRVRIDISTSSLIEAGYLSPTEVWLYIIRKPSGIHKRGWSQRLRNEAILENAHRNGICAALAQQMAENGSRVLIVTNRHNQVSQLAEALDRTGVEYQTIIGGDLYDERVAKIQRFISRESPVLVGTVFGEGVDIPEIDIVINAEGGKDIKATIQRMRNLTKSDGKRKAIFIDFMDLTNPYFADHSRERLAVYRSEPAFNVMIKEAA